ncbi:uncharacterized protein LOC128230383 [Mya arenaria]|uniref:uncharacterized protein LOC128230383 n=1 Tax=Mya arenaria TaxID=6604 RepID=UPI0022E5CF6A|nr:uncharacterized protein LOC128230383 [Mya arenaria]
MDKASRALRRSGAKLMSLGTAHGALNILLADLKEVKMGAKTFMEAQHQAAQDMMKWAVTEENRAVKDVISNIADLYLMWTDVQKNFMGYLKEYRQVFEMVLEGEKHVAQARDNHDYCTEKENRARKELKKCSKRASSSELRLLESRVEMAIQSKNLADVEVSERIRENEAVKLIRLKEGLLKMSDSYIEMAYKANIIFGAQKNVALQLPDVHGQELEHIQYSGGSTTRYLVDKVREKLQQFVPSNVTADPPPPYTPPEPSQPAGGRPDSPEQGRGTQGLDRRGSRDTPSRPCHPPAKPRHSFPQESMTNRPSSGEIRTANSTSDQDLPTYSSSQNNSNQQPVLMHSTSEVIVRSSSGPNIANSDNEDVTQRGRTVSDTIVHTNTVRIVRESESPRASGRSSPVVGERREAIEHEGPDTPGAKLYPDIGATNDDQPDKTRPVPTPRT